MKVAEIAANISHMYTFNDMRESTNLLLSIQKTLHLYWEKMYKNTNEQQSDLGSDRSSPLLG